MCLRLRNTTRRGRAAVPRTTWRIRRCRTARPSSRVLTLIVLASPYRAGTLLGAGLAGLFAHHLARVPDTLPLVGIGRAQGADLGGRLADQVLVHPAQRNQGLLVHLGLHALGQREHDRVRVPQVERQGSAGELGPEADALDAA